MTQPRSGQSDFWELLHAALGLQHSATRLSAAGDHEQASLLERQAIALLLEATCLLEPHEPALATVRQLAVAGLARLHTLRRALGRGSARRAPKSTGTPTPRGRRSGAQPTAVES